ncbi:hypothetical protein EVAR_50527_1 [Eumeta japonica]|uniref:Uncharacterized protein n=1 Tax=Eumeta variegata TaxID=151549 RepID=A0A4C1YRY2_EUMVA|nr:hypothetical protein EVAR_50527_1 [Eumeta japonica]
MICSLKVIRHRPQPPTAPTCRSGTALRTVAELRAFTASKACKSRRTVRSAEILMTTSLYVSILALETDYEDLNPRPSDADVSEDLRGNSGSGSKAWPCSESSSRLIGIESRIGMYQHLLPAQMLVHRPTPRADDSARSPRRSTLDAYPHSLLIKHSSCAHASHRALCIIILRTYSFGGKSVVGAERLATSACTNWLRRSRCGGERCIQAARAAMGSDCSGEMRTDIKVALSEREEAAETGPEREASVTETLDTQSIIEEERRLTI